MRRLKRRLLGCLNFFASTRRRLLCDLYGFGFRKATAAGADAKAGAGPKVGSDAGLTMLATVHTTVD